VGVSGTSPIDAGAKLALDIFVGNSTADECWNDFGAGGFGDTYAQLFCYFSANYETYIPPYPARDALGAVFSYSTTAEAMGAELGLLGFADDNWVNGLPTHEFIFGSSAYREVGFGFTSTIVHEFGHHIGMSHPHDGYDSEFGFDYAPEGPLYFAWLGDESDTVMHYIALSNGFGRHNQDNMHRWETAGYLNWANALAGDILAAPGAEGSLPAVHMADEQARMARTAFGRWQYLDAARQARLAFETLKREADRAGIASPMLAESLRLAALGIGPRKDGCRPRYPKE
jgi:hypothetical protein